MRKFIIYIFLLTSLGAFAQMDVDIQQFGEDDGYSQSRVGCITQDHQGIIWLATWDGLLCYDGYRFTCFKAKPGDNCPLDVNRIDKVQEMPDHNLLCRTGKNYFLFRTGTRQFERVTGNTYRMGSSYHPSDSIINKVRAIPMFSSVEIYCFFEDSQHGIWVCCNSGLYRIRFIRKPLKTVKLSGYNEEFICGQYCDRQGRVWSADKNNVVRIFTTPKGMPQYLTPAGMLSDAPTVFGHSIYCIYEDSRGWIWLGSKPDGLFRLIPQGGQYRITQYRADSSNPNSLSSNSIYAIGEDEFGRLWIGTYGGGLNAMTIQDESHHTITTPRQGFKDYPVNASEVRCLSILPEGILLMGTSNGFYTAKIGKDLGQTVFHTHVRDPEDAQSLGNNRVMGILHDTRGNTFVATYGLGMGKIISDNLLSDRLRFQMSTVEDGLSSDNNLSMIEDRQGNIWIISVSSLCCYDPMHDTFTNYSKGSFDHNIRFTEAQPLCMGDGTLILGTTQGTLEFNPQEVSKSRFVPRIVLQGDSVVCLSSNEKSLTLGFAALDFNKNSDIIYAYRLEGIDDDWHFTKENTIKYANIPAGDHTLRIKSTNGDGVWTDNERTITIHRSASFNEMPVAWMLYGGLLLAVIYGIYLVVRHIQQLRSSLEEVTTSSNERIDNLGSTIRSLLINKQADEKKEDLPPPRQFADSITAYLEKNFADPSLNVDTLAMEMGLSRSVLYKQMDKYFNATPSSFIQDMRIRKAKELVLKGGMSISEIAYKCGFSDPKYFSRCFKKATGVKPSEYKGEPTEATVAPS